VDGECVPDSQGCIDDCLAAGRSAPVRALSWNADSSTPTPAWIRSRPDCLAGEKVLAATAVRHLPDAGADSEPDSGGGANASLPAVLAGLLRPMTVGSPNLDLDCFVWLFFRRNVEVKQEISCKKTWILQLAGALA
jgi:hypothetical protein